MGTRRRRRVTPGSPSRHAPFACARLIHHASSLDSWVLVWGVPVTCVVQCGLDRAGERDPSDKRLAPAGPVADYPGNRIGREVELQRQLQVVAAHGGTVCPASATRASAMTP